MLVRLIAVLVALLAVAALYVAAALKWSYATGEQAGFVLKLSKRGWICKTWEGELAAVTLPGAVPERMPFTIVDDEVAQQVTRSLGRRVSLRWEEKVGLPTRCFGETRHYVTAVALAGELPVPAAAAASAAASGSAASASAPASAAPAPVAAPPAALPAPLPAASAASG